MFKRIVLFVTLVLALWAPTQVASAAGAKPKVHRVAKGQTLGKIAKRYRISVDALKYANDLGGRLIKPGQRLLVPPRSDPDGKKTREVHDQRVAAEEKQEQTKTKQEEAKRGSKRGADRGSKRGSKRGAEAKASETRWHVVAKRQNLGSIARRYDVTVDALRHANDLGPKGIIKPKQRLIVPAPDDVDGERARSERLAAAERQDSGADAPRAVEGKGARKDEKSWQPYVQRPKRKNWVELRGRVERSWAGYVLTRRGNVRKKAKDAFTRVLATRQGDEHEIDPRLIALVAKVSDTFGGRPIQVVSGFRLGATRTTSRHRQGRAIDIHIEGVPNTALRDYVKTFDQVGVGYYPNSSFVHLDVREQWTYWIDYSGPGQRPRYGGFWTKGSPGARKGDGDH